jgi:hypothetical protein
METTDRRLRSQSRLVFDSTANFDPAFDFDFDFGTADIDNPEGSQGEGSDDRVKVSPFGTG